MTVVYLDRVVLLNLAVDYLLLLATARLAGLLLAMGLAAGSPEALLSRVYHADVSWPVLLGSAIGFGLLLHLVFRQGARHEGGELMDVTVSLQGRRQRLRALHDTCLLYTSPSPRDTR